MFRVIQRLEFKTRGIKFLITGMILGILVVHFNPVQTTLSKLLFLSFIFGLWLGFLVLVWRHKTLRFLFLVFPLFVASPFFLPKKKIDTNYLRNRYLSNLERFEGTRYWWGGENKFGIDCSGLPRKAFREALLRQVFKNLMAKRFVST